MCSKRSSRDTGVSAIEQLIQKRGKFDYILLETTGLADPGNIAPIFWLDDNLGSSIYLDGIVTMVDASNILRTLDDVQAQDNQDRLLPFATEITTAHLQISHADVIIINKIDLVTPQQLEAVKQRIYSINGLAHVVATSKGKVPRLEGLVLDLSAYDEVTKIEDSKFSRGGPANHLDPVCPFFFYCSNFGVYIPFFDCSSIEERVCSGLIVCQTEHQHNIFCHSNS